MSIGWPEVIGILFLVILLFGSTKLPEAARSVGRSMRIFKSEMKEMSEDNNPNQLPASNPAQLQQPVQQPQPIQQGQPVQQAQPVEQPVQPTTNPVNPQPPQGQA
ncbi:Sec-independent protein translocase subunit TatA [Corynebacterium argentoratense]|uniref:Sec-independent protein translocase subunit TatA n=1 Tax=Corynebacterium argentoratense TaxID=42817 RepID=UPI001F3BB672|nr:Sec-independent protein translocase subunit TatA [Corynebacterium argentoratense]MCF1711587.1 Sec-independent protein translocase subunit TatA [Corynebacterium argentoratense]